MHLRGVDRKEFIRDEDEIGTANFIEPRIMPRIIEDLEQYVKKEELSSIEDIIGIL